MFSPDSSYQNDSNYESAVQDIEQEKKMVAALKRLSIGNLMQYDPDLPPGSMDEIDPFAASSHLQEGGAEFYDEDLIPQNTRHVRPHSSSLSSGTGSPSKSPSKSSSSSTSPKRDDGWGRNSPVRSRSSTTSPIRNPNLHAPSSFNNKSPSPVKRHSLYMDNDSILTAEEEFFDAAEDQVYDAANTMWLPAELHPQVNPDSFKTLIKHQVEDIMDRNLKRRSTISRRSTLSRQPSITDHEEVPVTTVRVPKPLPAEPSQTIGDSSTLSRTPSAQSSKSTSPPKDPIKRESWYNKQKRFSNPSLKELTTELQQMSKIAGMDKSDAVTVARTLSSNALGYTDVEKLAFDEMKQSPPHSDTSGTSNTLHLQQRLQQQFNQSLAGGDAEEEEEEKQPDFYSSAIPLQGLHRDFALKRSRRTDYRKKDSEHLTSPDESPLSRKQVQQQGKPTTQKGYRSRDSQLLFTYKKIDDEPRSEQVNRQMSPTPQQKDAKWAGSFSTTQASPYLSCSNGAKVGSKSQRQAQQDAYYSRGYANGRQQEHYTPQRQRQDIIQQENFMPEQLQYPSQQQQQRQSSRQHRSERHSPNLPPQRQQYSGYIHGNRRESPCPQERSRNEQMSRSRKSSRNNVENYVPAQSRVKPIGSHHQQTPERKLMSASNTNVNDFMIETPTKQSRRQRSSHRNREQSRHVSQRPQPDVPMLFPSSKDPENFKGQQIQPQPQPQQPLPPQQDPQYKSRSSSRPSGPVPARSKQLHQNLDLLRSEINEFKESLNKDKHSAEGRRTAPQEQPQQLPQDHHQQSHIPQNYQVRQTHRQQQPHPQQEPPHYHPQYQQQQQQPQAKNISEADLSFDVSYQDLSTDDPLGIEEEALLELGRKRDGYRDYGAEKNYGYDAFDFGEMDHDYSHSRVEATPEQKPPFEQTTPPENEPPLKQSTPEHEPLGKQTTPEQDFARAKDDLFANIPDVDEADFSDLDDEPILEAAGLGTVDVQHPHGNHDGFDLSSGLSSEPREDRLDEPFLKNYMQAQPDSSSHPKTSSKPTKVNTKLFKKANIQIIDSDNYEEKMGLKKNKNDDKTLRKKKSFGILSGGNTGGSNLTPPTSNELDFDGEKKLKKKRSWNLFRERSSSMSSLDSQQPKQSHQSHQSQPQASMESAPNPKVPLPARSFSNPERTTKISERELDPHKDRKYSQEFEESASVHSDKENVLSKLFKKKSKANLSGSSVSSVHSQESKNSGVTIDYHDHNKASSESQKVKKKTSGLFKKRSKAKLVDHDRNSGANSTSSIGQDTIVHSSLRKDSTEILSPQSSNNMEDVTTHEDVETPLLQELNPQRLKMDSDIEEYTDDDENEDVAGAFASFGENVDPQRKSGEQERTGMDEDRKLATMDINSLDSNEDVADSASGGLKSKKSTVRKHKRYRHRKKDKASEAKQEETSENVVEATAVKDEAPAPIEKDVDNSSKTNAEEDSESGLTKEQQQLAKIDIQEKLKKSIKRTSKANQPIEFTDSAFGFPLPPPSQSTIIMLDYRFPVHVERAIYRLSHLKLANPKRSLREQVLLSNFMYAYLNLVDHTLHMEQQLGGSANGEEGEGNEQEDGDDDESDDSENEEEEEDETMVDPDGEDVNADEHEEEHVLDHFGTDGGVDVDFGEDIVGDDDDDDDVVIQFSNRRHQVIIGSPDDEYDDEFDDDNDDDLLPNEERLRISV
ncbi:ZDS1 [Candida metapsilosis]|uniref:ZDS1 n=1 Tax=Candida metapsilosis TaxID=273372 RepID=A0A8H7ZHA1_9ASCO|nr:ZDS1 [Candida metapsilosis]